MSCFREYCLKFGRSAAFRQRFPVEFEQFRSETSIFRSCNGYGGTKAQMAGNAAYYFTFRARLSSLELMVKPADFAAELLMSNRTFWSTIRRFIIPPAAMKLSVSLTVKMLAPRRLEIIFERRLFSESLINRT